jgi:YaiO family outer membrane protein
MRHHLNFKEKYKSGLLLLFVIPLSYLMYGQDTLTLRKDSLRYHRAVYWAKKGEHDKAKKLCLFILAKEPHQVKAEILLGRLYSWDKQFDSARIFLKDAVSREPNNEEALLAMANNELWAGNTTQAMVYCNTALRSNPNSEKLLIKKAKIYNKQRNFKESYKTVKQVLQINPDNQEAIEFEKYLRTKLNGPQEKRSTGKNGIGVYYQYDHFNDPVLTPWQYGSLYFFHRGSRLNMLAGINYANRLQTSGIQYDLNLAAKISPAMKILLGAAYSQDSILPGWNLSAGLAHTIFKKGEVELGLRYLTFNNFPNSLLMYTGALSWSFSRVRLSARAYLADQQAGTYQSYYLTTKYYCTNPMKNITLVLNTGTIPHDYFDPTSGKTFNYPTWSHRARLGYQTPLFSAKTIFKCSIGYENRKYYSGLVLERATLGLGLERLF